MIKTYELYLIKSFFQKILKISAIFFVLIFILNIFEEISFFKDTGSGLLFTIFIGILNVPSTVFEIFPFIFLIATQFFFLEIINKNELEILKINGLSNLKVLRTLFLTSLILGVFLISIFYAFSSKLKFIYLDIKNSYSKDNKYLAVVKDNGVWIKDEIDNKIYIITSTNIVGDFLINVSINEFDNNFNLIRVIESRKTKITNFKWRILEPRIFNDNRVTSQKEFLTIKTHFNKAKINNLFNNLTSLNIFQLLRLRIDYKSLGYSTAAVDSHLHKLYSFPLFVSIMTVLTSIIMFNNKRNRSMVFHLILGIFLSVVIYYFYYLFNLLGENGKMPIVLSIYLPFLLLSLISMIGLIKLNEK